MRSLGKLVFAVMLVIACNPVKMMDRQNFRNLIIMEDGKPFVFYPLVYNPVKISSVDHRLGNLFLHCDTSKAIIRQIDSSNYSIYPKGFYSDLDIGIYRNRINPRHFIGTHKFQVSPLPIPTVSFNGNSGGSITKGALMAVRIVSCTTSNFHLNGVYYKVVSFSYAVIRKNREMVLCFGDVDGKILPIDLRDFLTYSIEKGDIIHLYNIDAKANAPDWPVQRVSDLTFVVE